MDRRFLNFSFIIFAFFFVGCASPLPRLDINKSQSFRPCKIVVFPFKNETKNPVVARLVYRLFVNEISNDSTFRVVPEGWVRHFMMMERCLVGEDITPSLMKLLAKRTNAQAIITGEILQFERKGDDIKLSFVINVRDINTGKLLWSTYHSRTAEEYRKILHYGRIYTVTGLAKNMIHEILEQWRNNKLGGCE